MAQIALALVNKNDTPKTSILVDSSGNEITTGNPLVTTANLATGSAVEILDGAGTNKLAVDTLGRLTLVPNQVVELGDGTTPTQKLAIDASGRLTLVPTQTVEILDSAGTNKLAIDTSGRLTLVPNQVMEIGDGTTPTQKLAIDASGRLTLVPTQTVEILDSAGTNKLAIDASGRLTLIPNSSVNIAQYNGSNVSATNPFFTQDFIRQQSILGHRWSVSTGKIVTATNANIYIILDILINNIAKNFLLDSVIWTAVNAQVDGRINILTSTTLDTNATTDLIAGNNVINLQTAATNSSSISAAKASSGNSAPALGALIGTQATASIGVPANQSVQLLQNNQVIYVPTTGVLQIVIYGVMATAAQGGYFTASWLEF